MFAILVAAGSGTRMQSSASGEADSNISRSKILLPLSANSSVFELALKGVLDSGVIDGVVVVSRPDDNEVLSAILEQVCGSRWPWFLVDGGSTRQESVMNGLRACKGKTRFVLVHDAARPLVDPDVVSKVAERARQCGACIAAVPLKPSLKRVKDGWISETVLRDAMWEAQTPQAFSVEILEAAHLAAARDSYVGTDDSELVERLGTAVAIVEGRYRNLKITTPEDLELAALLLSRARHQPD